MIQQKKTRMIFDIQNFTISHKSTTHFVVSEHWVYISTYFIVPNHPTKGYKDIMETFRTIHGSNYTFIEK